jgi:hypothetical protein
MNTESSFEMSQYLQSKEEHPAEKEKLPLQKSETQEEQPKTPEAKEQAEKVMERAKNKRVELFKKVFLSRAIKLVEAPLFLKIVNFAPIVGDVTLLAGAIRGKEGGRQLSAGERLNYVAAVGMSALTYISAYEGNLKTAGIEQAMVYALLHIDALPVALKNSAKALENKTPKLAHMMEATADYMNQKREELAKLGEMFTADTFISLGLNANEA